MWMIDESFHSTVLQRHGNHWRYPINPYDAPNVLQPMWFRVHWQSTTMGLCCPERLLRRFVSTEQNSSSQVSEATYVLKTPIGGVEEMAVRFGAEIGGTR